MNELIEVKSMQLAGVEVQSVNARDLHAFLESGKHFANWMKDRITQYGFIENKDYEVFAEIGNNPSGGRPAKEYMISLDMAKELSMVERNEKGKQARQYFIECERRAKAGSNPLEMLNNPAAMRELLLGYSEKVLSLQQVVEEQAPKVRSHDRIADADGSLCIRDAAKALQVRPKDLTNWLVINHWLYQRPGHSGWLAYQERIQKGVMCHKVTTLENRDGDEKIVNQARITPKGLTQIGQALAKGLVAA